jgi:hypothetical protein
LTIAQTFVVDEAKKCFSFDNKKIRNGDTLDITSGFSIEKNGKITIRHANDWYSRYTIPMKYKIDTLFTKLTLTKEYVTHDSIFNVLQQNNIHHCEFPYKFICKPIFGGVATSLADDIKQEGNYIIETNETNLKIEWTYPTEYKGRYFILISNMFDEYIDVKVTSDSYFNLDLMPYKPQHAILYKVVSDECRESRMNLIKWK